MTLIINILVIAAFMAVGVTLNFKDKFTLSRLSFAMAGGWALGTAIIDVFTGNTVSAVIWLGFALLVLVNLTDFFKGVRL